MTVVVALLVGGLVLALAALRPGGPTLPGHHRVPGPTGRPPATGAPAWFEEVAAAAGVTVADSRAWRRAQWAVRGSVAVIAVAVSPAAALLAVGVAAVGLRAMRPALRRRRLDQRDAQLPAALERLASSLRAGSAPGPAIVALAATTGGPLGVELRAMAAELEHGAGVGDALARWAARPEASGAVRLAAAALSLGVEAGGEMARSVDRVAATVRERRELRAEARSLATQARASAAVLGLAPLGFSALVATVEPEMVRFLVSTPAGLACLGAGLTLEVVGARWMARIVDGAT
jgi:tight adherence protein B